MNFIENIFRKKITPVVLSLKETIELTSCLSQAVDLQLEGHYAPALLECTKAILLDPNSYLAYRIQALAKFNQGDQEGGITDWIKSNSLKEGVGRNFKGLPKPLKVG